MAIGTGFVVGYFSSVVIVVYIPPFNALIGSFLGFIIYQFASFSLFFGNRRGEFEFEYRNDLSENVVRKYVRKFYGFSTYINYFQDQFNAMRPAQKEICQNLLNNCDNDDCKFSLYYKLARLEFVEDNSKKEKKMLKSALEINPYDLLANYRYAESCEMDGFVDEAIYHYELASKDPYLVSTQLKDFILLNIERIKRHGPRNRPVVLGAKYQSY